MRPPAPAPSMERDLSMICGPEGRRARKDNLVAGAGRFLMRREEAEAIFAEVVQTVGACWQGAMSRAGVAAADRETVRTAFLPDGLLFPQQP